jgi:hypothetical protein
MARGEEKSTVGTWVESKVQGSLALSGLGAGAATGLSLVGSSGANSVANPEGAAITAGALGSIAAGGIAGLKIAGKIDGKVAERIDNLKPSRFQDGELYLDERDPFGLEVSKHELQRLDDSRLEQVRNYSSIEVIDEFDLFRDLYRMAEEKDEVDEWVDERVYGEINGFRGDFRTNRNYSGDFKTGYVDRENEVFVQAPKHGDTFEGAMERVQTWRENNETLDQADQYLDQILENEGTKTASRGLIDIEIDYDFLRKHEETLRDEVEGGIMTPSENYGIVVTSHEGEPLPVLVGDFNQDMVERGSDMYDLEDSEEVKNRKQILGMYMDALMEEDEFEGHLADYWFDEGCGREATKNMFYDLETDTVGVTDIGEHMGSEPDQMPDITLEERYAY